MLIKASKKCLPIAKGLAYCTTEVITIYYCEVSEKIHEGGGLEGEDLEIVEMDLNEVLSTRFRDAKTIIGVNYISQNRGKFSVRAVSPKK